MIIWPFIPQMGVTESFEWLTDVVRCKAGEERISLRMGPRQSFQYTSQLTASEYAQAKILSRDIDGEFECPVWINLFECPNLSPLQDVITGDYSQFPHGPALVWESSSKWERVIVVFSDENGIGLDSGLSQGYSRPLIVPLQTVTMMQPPDFSESNGGIWTSRIRTVFVGYTPVIGEFNPPQYRGIPVLIDPNISVTRLTEQHYRDLDEVDGRTGVISQVARYRYAETKSNMMWSPTDRAELASTMDWIHTRKGKRNPFWYLSPNNDLVARSNLSSNSGVTPNTDKVEITRVIGLKAPFDICIENINGSMRYYRVQLVGSVFPDKQSLILSGNQGSTWLLEDILRIRIMHGVRFDSDRVEIKHSYSGSAKIAVPLIEVPGL